MKRYAVLVLIGLAGCTTGSNEPKSVAYKAEMNSYVRCNMVSARDIAKQPGDPLSLAVAAQGMCSSEEAAVTRAIRPTFSDPLAAERTMAKVNADMLKTNAGIIVKVRGGA
jgi:hypothetical protein